MGKKERDRERSLEGQESLGSRWPAASRVTLSTEFFTYFYPPVDCTRVTLSTEFFTYFYPPVDCTNQSDTFHRVLVSQRDMLNNRGGGSCSVFRTKQILVEKWAECHNNTENRKQQRGRSVTKKIKRSFTKKIKRSVTIIRVGSCFQERQV